MNLLFYIALKFLDLKGLETSLLRASWKLKYSADLLERIPEPNIGSVVSCELADFCSLRQKWTPFALPFTF